MPVERPHGPKLRLVRLWDPGLRLFHWALVICVAFSWYMGEFGPGIMTLHFWSGYAIIGLLGFRLVWGLFGPWPARFRDFLYSPGSFLAYLRSIPARRPSYWPGHNPVGALSVYLLLSALAVQAYTGLYANPEDFINFGPLYSEENAVFSSKATKLHHLFGTLILLLVLLHVGAILFYRLWKGESLVPAMIHGRKLVRGEVPESRILESDPQEAE